MIKKYKLLENNQVDRMEYGNSSYNNDGWAYHIGGTLSRMLPAFVATGCRLPVQGGSQRQRQNDEGKGIWKSGGGTHSKCEA